MSRYLITGANGFVGTALCAELNHRGYTVRAAVRHPHWDMPRVEIARISHLNESTDWQAALADVGVIIHCASRVHIMHEAAADPLAEFRRVNVAATENLARQAAQAGVHRLVFVSSIKVNGENTAPGHAYTEQDTPAPDDPYGISKWEAEQVLQRVSAETGLQVVIVRPPLMYGPGVKGNFLRLLNAVEQEWPMPLRSATDNARSLLYLGNFVDALITCATHPAAAGQTYLVSDGTSPSTAQLFEALTAVMHRRNHSLSISPLLLRRVANWLGKKETAERLFGSLRIDDHKIRQELGWTPPYTSQQGLQITADWYLQQRI